MKIFNIILISAMLGLVSAAIYDVGETVSVSHQNISFPVCYGDYPNDELKLADLNGDLNGGDYQVIFINCAASW